jgi:lipopolysaccharide export system protein LptA
MILSNINSTSNRLLSKLSSFVLLVLIAVMTWHPAALALKNDQSKSIHLKAASVNYDYKKGVIIYSGNVHGVQGSTNLWAEKMTIYLNHNHKIEKAIATGHFAHYSTQPNERDALLHAWATTITYYPIAGKVILVGDARIQQNKNIFTSHQINYDIFNEMIYSHPGAKSTASIILEPIKTLTQRFH